MSGFQKLLIHFMSGSNTEGDRMRMRSEFENKLDDNNVQFARIRDKNINFVLCEFHRFVLYVQKECFVFLF